MRALVLLLVTATALPALAQKPVQIAAGPVEAPFSLTAADGTGLALVGFDGRAVVDGPLAFTEVRLTFQNPQARTIEGHFKVVMPDGAAISRFAMKIRGDWMEGEVVEKQAARRAYEDALHRKQDPALLEQDAGNTFMARVFPIQAHERKEIIVSWSNTLTQAGEAYRLPLRGLPKIQKLELTAMTAGEDGGGAKTSLGGTQSRYRVSRVEKADFKPDEDWVIFGGDIPVGGDALRNDRLAVARFVVRTPDAQEPGGTALVLFDTSASRALEYTDRLARLRALVNRLPDIGIKQVEVVAFDQFTEPVFNGDPKAFGDAQIEKLVAREALGASDLGVAIDAAGRTKADRLIVFTDGVATAGERNPQKLAERAARLSANGIGRLDVVVDTTARDARTLEALATAKLPRTGKVVEGKAPIETQLAKLGRRTLPDARVNVPGAEWVWPESAAGLQDGDAVVVFADLPAMQPLTVEIATPAPIRVTPAVRPAERPLLERAWVAARIDRLLSLEGKSDRDLAEGLRHQIINLSTKHRVLSPYTALVVLETENDYARFGIDRRALAEILTVGATGVEVLARQNIAVAVATPPPPRPRPAPTGGRKGRAGGDAAPGARAPSKASVADDRAEGAAAPEPMLADAEDDGADKDLAKKEAEPAPEMKAKLDEAPADSGGAAASARAAGPSGGATAATMAPPATAAVEAPAPAAPPPPPRPAEERSRRDADGQMAERERRAPPAQVATGDSSSRPDPFPGSRRPQAVAQDNPGRREFNEIEKGAAALTGRFAEIARDVGRGRAKAALATARTWRNEDPTDLLALVAMGQALGIAGDGVRAARAFGSILDLYPARADMRRFAGNWLERLGRYGLVLAADTYAVAAEQRPDHPAVYHQLAMTLLRLGRYEEALTTALNGIQSKRAEERFQGVDRILREDVQLIAAAWAAVEPERRADIERRLAGFGLRIDGDVSMRFVLTWETDANDVDFHIFDRDYRHAYYSQRELPSGGELYADITTGYGPECFTVYDAKSFPYRLKAHYYSRGPMGYGMGKLQVIRHDGKGGLGFEDRPFVIMSDGAYVDLGTVGADAAKPVRTEAVRQAVAK